MENEWFPSIELGITHGILNIAELKAPTQGANDRNL